jgi:hypothetical protein
VVIHLSPPMTHYLIVSRNNSSLILHNFDKTTHDFYKMALLTKLHSDHCCSCESKSASAPIRFHPEHRRQVEVTKALSLEISMTWIRFSRCYFDLQHECTMEQEAHLLSCLKTSWEYKKQKSGPPAPFVVQMERSVKCWVLILRLLFRSVFLCE